MKKFDLSKVKTSDEKYTEYTEARRQLAQAIRGRVKCTDYLTRAPKGGYICIYCGSGTGQHGTGAVKYYKNTNTCTCFACGKTFDEIDLIQKKNGCDYNKALEIGAGILGVDLPEYGTDNSGNAYKNRVQAAESILTPAGGEISTTEEKPQKTADYTAYYEICAKRLEDPEAISYLSARGISKETAQEHKIGYDPAADPATAPGATGSEYKPHPEPRIIGPCNKSYYIARSINPATPVAYKKMNPARDKGAGPVALFNADAIKGPAEVIFITEGLFDALSFTEIGEEAISLNSKNNGAALEELLQEQPAANCLAFVIVPDNDENPTTDEATKKTANNLKDSLQEMGYNAIVYNVAGKYHDANDALVKDKALFIARTENARQAALKGVPSKALAEIFKQWADGAELTQAQTSWLIENTDFTTDYTNFFFLHGLLTPDGVPTEHGQAIMDKPAADQPGPAEDPAASAEPADYMTEFLEKIQTEAYKPYKTELSFFDDLLNGGVIRQTLLLLLAAPGTGKTTLCSQIAEQMAEHGKPVIYFNLEMSREQMIAKAISARLARKGVQITALEVMQGYNWTDEQRTAVIEAVQEYSEKIQPYLEYNPATAGKDIENIRAYLQTTGEAAKAAGKEAPVIIMDYLHLITSRAGLETQELIKQAVTMLKDYASNFDTFVIGIAATNRTSNSAGRITLESGRDSSNLEYTADYQLSLNYYDVDNGTISPTDVIKISELQQQKWRQMIIRVLKGRFCVPGKSAKVYFNAANNIFYGANDWLPADPARVPFNDPQSETPKAGNRR